MAYKFKHQIEYELESDNQEDAIYELVELIRNDWIYYADEGDLEEVESSTIK